MWQQHVLCRGLEGDRARIHAHHPLNSLVIKHLANLAWQELSWVGLLGQVFWALVTFNRSALEAIATRLEAIATGRPSLLGWRPLLPRWRPSLVGFHVQMFVPCSKATLVTFNTLICSSEWSWALHVLQELLTMKLR